MFDVRSFEAKNKVFEFDDQSMNMFEFVQCSKNDVRVRSMFDKMVFDTSLGISKHFLFLSGHSGTEGQFVPSYDYHS